MSMMREISYETFSRKIHARNERIPLNVTLELTYRCNNRCVHCYCGLPPDDPARQAELTLDEITDLLDQLRKMGSLWLLLTGGEALLRPDFTEIYLAAKKRGFLVTVFTNATLITDEITTIFRRYPPFTVEVTMYGATARTYETVSRLPGSYRLYQQGLKRLLAAGIEVKLKTMALTVNQHEIKDMERQAKELGCHFRFDPLLHARIDERDFSAPEQYRLSPAEVVTLEELFPGRMEEHREYCERVGTTPVVSDYILTCGAGRNTLHIMPDGRVAPCSMLLKSAVSCREQSLASIWNTHFSAFRAQKKTFTLACDQCRRQPLCSQCPGWSMVEHDRFDTEVGYLCNIARTRAQQFTFVTEEEMS